MNAATDKTERQEYRLELVLVAILLLTVIILCAANPLLTVAVLLGVLSVALVGAVRLVLFLIVLAIPLFPSVRNFAALETIRCDEFLLVALGAMWLTRALVGRRIVIVGKHIMLLQLAAIIWGVVGFTYLAMRLSGDIHIKDLFVTYKRVQCLLLFFLVVQEVDTLRKAKHLLGLTILVSCLVSVIGLLQFVDFGAVRDFLGKFYTVPWSGRTHPWRVTSTFDSHPNALGAYYVIVLSLLTAIMALSPRRFLNPVWAGILALGYATVLATASRAGLLALVIGVVVISVMGRLWLVLVMTPPIGLALYFIGGRMSERLIALYEAVAYGRIPMHHSLGRHLRHWSLALEKMEGMPFVGLGYGGDRAFAINRYLDNYYLYLVYHEGYLSLILFLALLAVSLSVLYRIAANCRDDFVRASAAGLLAGLVGLCVHAVGADTFTWERVAMVLWLCLALVIRADSLVEEQRLEGRPDDVTVRGALHANTATKPVKPEGR